MEREDFLDSINPVLEQVPPGALDLDDSEEEIECDEDPYTGVDENNETEDEDTEDENEEPIVPTAITAAGLPPPPPFVSFQHHAPPHTCQVLLPDNFTDHYSTTASINPDEPQSETPKLTPSSFFQLFFTEVEFDVLVQNTNSYAGLKGAGDNGRRRWRPTSAAELKVFIGIIIYMGVHKAMHGPLYWNHNREFPSHDISHYMSKYRFEQLKRYFHIAPTALNRSLPRCRWASKLQPLANNLPQHFQQYFISATNISVDEMMVRFTGRSCHTIMMRAKPIPQGYKMLALCECGYTYAFMFTSSVDSFTDLNNNLYTGTQKLSPTSRAVFQLVMSLSFRFFRFILYCDNYFSYIPLFTALREYSIAACGTVRPNSANYPTLFKQVKKQKVSLPWNTISAIICGTVLAVLWQDKNLVRFLTTAHKCTPDDQNFSYRNRRRPQITRANRQLIQQGWGEAPVRNLSMPLVSIQYNVHMGGVDIADQRRSYYYTQLRVCRNWLPLFFWLLDTAIINAFITMQETLTNPSRSQPFWRHHGYFRTRLAWNLVLEGFQEINPQYEKSLRQFLCPPPTGNGRFCPGTKPKGNNSYSRRNGYVGKNHQLSAQRKAPANHHLQKATKQLCVLCRYLSKCPERAEAFNNPNGPRGKVWHTSYECSYCKEPLCKGFCMRVYHGLDI